MACLKTWRILEETTRSCHHPPWSRSHVVRVGSARRAGVTRTRPCAVPCPVGSLLTPLAVSAYSAPIVRVAGNDAAGELFPALVRDTLFTVPEHQRVEACKKRTLSMSGRPY